MKNGDEISIVVADDHFVVRTGLVTVLENTPGLRVVGQAEDGAEAVARATELKPDVIIMDLQMPVKDGLEATREIVRVAPNVRILVLTTFDSSDSIAQALEAGATGALLKSASKGELIAAIRQVAAGARMVSAEVMELLRSDPPVEKLTDRQKEVLRTATMGFSTKDISRILGISPNVVKLHLNAIFAKLGASNRAEAVAIALRKRLFKV